MRLAKSEIRGISGEEAIENLVLQPAGRRENDFASSLHDRRAPPRMNMCYNSAVRLALRSFLILVP
jgi:hypothetical protein